MKRLIDLVASLCGLIILSPALMIVAAVIRVFDGSPVLFCQTRVGKNGVSFQIYKFRTMIFREGAERGDFDAGDDARITEIGKILRKTKLDELPQLFNVLKGDMSLVGPRPEVRKWVDCYSQRWEKVLCVRPGITDPASIVYFNEGELLSQSDDPKKTYRDIILPDKLSIYEDYVNNLSVARDLIIIWRTILKLVNLTK